MSASRSPLPYRKLSMHPVWNLGLLTAGAALIAFAAQGVAAHQGFLTGGVMGVSLLAWYATDMLSAPVWNLMFNLPLFLFAWFHIGRRFVLYSLYGMLAVFLWSLLMDKVPVAVQNPIYASVMAGAVAGMGGGIMLRSLGSGGGMDLVGVYINQKWSIPLGKVFFSFNAVLFLLSATIINLDMVIASFIQVFISSAVTDYVLRMFNQRKIVFIVTGKGQEICNAILDSSGRATLIPAYGGYSHEPKEIVMTITTNFTLRNLEDIVFSIDPHALFTVEDTLYVSGTQYPRKAK